MDFRKNRTGIILSWCEMKGIFERSETACEVRSTHTVPFVRIGGNDRRLEKMRSFII
jgi:hypothetical protein